MKELPSDGPLTILGLTWSTGEPMVRLRRGDEPSSLFPVVGMNLTYRVDPDGVRRCIGHTGAKKRDEPIDCPNTPEAGSKTCTSCSVKNALFAGSLHHSHLRGEGSADPEMAAHLAQPNRVYLAAFRDGSVKVGTSTTKRADTRLAEQGAWMARFVADTENGIAVRQLEDLITSRLGLTQSVTITRKLTGLAQPRTDDWLNGVLLRHAEQVRELIRSLDGTDVSSVTPADAAWSNPALIAGDWPTVHRYPHRLSAGSHEVCARSAVGSAIAFTRPGSTDTFVADVRQLFGVPLLIGEAAPEPVTVQDSLF